MIYQYPAFHFITENNRTPLNRQFPVRGIKQKKRYQLSGTRDFGFNLFMQGLVNPLKPTDQNNYVAPYEEVLAMMPCLKTDKDSWAVIKKECNPFGRHIGRKANVLT